MRYGAARGRGADGGAAALRCGLGGGERHLGDGVEPPAPDGHASAGLFALGPPGGILYALGAAHGRRNFGLLRHFSRNLRRNLAGKISFRPRPHPRDKRKAPWKRIKSPVPERGHRIQLIPKSKGTFLTSCLQNCKIKFVFLFCNFGRYGGLLNAKGNPDGSLSLFSSLRNLRPDSFLTVWVRCLNAGTGFLLFLSQRFRKRGVGRDDDRLITLVDDHAGLRTVGLAQIAHLCDVHGDVLAVFGL